MQQQQPPKAESPAFTALQASTVALLTTFRRNGQGVGTPVGIKVAGGKAYFTTWSTTGKVKRLARDQHVTLAPFAKRRRKVIGPTVAGTARRLEPSEVERLATLFPRGLWDRLWHWIYSLRGWQVITYEVSPIDASDPAYPSSSLSSTSSRSS